MTLGAAITLVVAYGPREAAPFVGLAFLITGCFVIMTAESNDRFETLARDVVGVTSAGHVLDLFPRGAHIDRLEVVLSSEVSDGLDADLSALCQRFDSVTLYHAVDVAIPRARASLRRLPLLERGHLSRLLWEQDGQKRLALYSESRSEWVALPHSDSVHEISRSLQRYHEALEPRMLFTDYEWVCECLADEMDDVLGIRSLASDGIVHVSGTDRIRKTQKKLTTSAGRIWAIDQTRPQAWLQGDLWDMLILNRVISQSSGSARRIFVIPEQHDDAYIDTLCQLLFIHRELGIEFGVVDTEAIGDPLLADQTLYGNAVLWEETKRGDGHFRANGDAIKAFVAGYTELWDRGNGEAQRQGAERLERWIRDCSEKKLSDVEAWVRLALQDADNQSGIIEVPDNNSEAPKALTR